MTGLLRRGGRDAGTAIGAWVKLGSSESCEILSDAGFDFVVVDLEHTMMDLSQTYHHIVIGTALGLRVLVRLPDRSPSQVQRVLDAGADGVVGPHVDDAADAAALVSAARFPTRGGTRGSGATSRAGRWAALPRATYLEQQPLVVVQAESADAVDAADAIAKTEGVGAVMLGPADLSLDPVVASGDLDREVASTTIFEAGRRAGILTGAACGLADAPAAIARGYDFVVCASDVTMLAAAASRAISQLQESTSGAFASSSTGSHS